MKELENRAAIVIRGLQDPQSGWYNSPDDLQAVIEGQLDLQSAGQGVHGWRRGCGPGR